MEQPLQQVLANISENDEILGALVTDSKGLLLESSGTVSPSLAGYVCSLATRAAELGKLVGAEPVGQGSTESLLVYPTVVVEGERRSVTVKRGDSFSLGIFRDNVSSGH
ncbi:hypothetical protein M427DRAFT_134319 [Gonapodya prolifera JEL478]|uniref:Late endosomal/lysosomal adaptor and MAPK and MTOR activator 5 n=1 Tax=Gonapodya prolifera (strain JEL478) TaxID=1344416 RepID=A0A139AHS9_GONPJ|nr:hypothetical protein M427DRAFT_134319 [Gonapodya prolifera JEL478]|eukprot:KXS16288.1 hypothetical protein M427DRAFT_134319 [Gonapodya prolifera JEL478]